MHNRFGFAETWQDYDNTEEIKRKTGFIISLIPDDVQNIADIGCGNGIITNELAKKWDVTGLDFSEEALKSVKCPSVKASVSQIPFADQSFDFVLCSEVLEHLSDDDLVQAVAELKRISKKYLLVTVPNQEFLRVSFTLCPACFLEFHIWHHFQSFSPTRLEKIFKPEFAAIQFHTLGAHQRKWIPCLLRMKQRLGQWMFPDKITVCPQCGNRNFIRPRSNLVTKLINLANLVVAGRKPYWQLLLLQRKS